MASRSKRVRPREASILTSATTTTLETVGKQIQTSRRASNIQTSSSAACLAKWVYAVLHLSSLPNSTQSQIDSLLQETGADLAQGRGEGGVTRTCWTFQSSIQESMTCGCQREGVFIKH
jgi:hypothetical protein